MNYISVCSGIEAATVAWHPLGWRPAAFAEIEKFPAAVLETHYPTVPNRGDMTKFNTWPDESIDLLVGGTPCQAFSVAGLRKGLDDPRGNLTLTFLAMARKFRPRWLVWENVPGVLSDRTNAFGQFLSGLGQLGYGWAYRVLDAQYFGVAQRRRRVFVVAYLGDWRRAAAVLFERESLLGDSPPSRESGQRATGTLSARTEGGGGLGTDFDLAGGLQASTGGADENDAQACRLIAADVAPTLNAHFGEKQGLENQHIDGGGACSLPPLARALTSKNQRNDAETETLIPTRQGGFFDGVTHALKGEGHDASEDGTGRGVPITLAIRGRNGQPSLEIRQDGLANAILTANGGRAGIGVGAVAFSAKDHGADAGDISPTLRAGGHTGSHANGGVMPAVAFSNSAGDTALGMSLPGVPPITRRNGDPGNVLMGMTVRRLTPRECERLQGFPDDYTRITYRNKLAPDGPRYKALGNSMAVPVMAWIGRRIAVADTLLT